MEGIKTSRQLMMNNVTMKKLTLLWILFVRDIRVMHSSPTREPTDIPSFVPSASPTAKPSREPSVFPTRKPSADPTSKPSHSPTDIPSKKPSSAPSDHPSSNPSVSPSDYPTTLPSINPSSLPTTLPSSGPSLLPSASPSGLPSISPSRSKEPSESPTFQCANDLSFYANYDREQTCDYIGEADNRNDLCVSSKIYLACPVTCGICCRDNGAFTIRINNNVRDCDWIGGNLERRLLYCGITTNGVRDNCSKTCDRCFKEAPLPSAAPSSAPTVTCVNSPTYFFLEEERTCAWIDLKGSRRSVYCQNKEVWQNCPLVCGVCCVDDPTFTFQINENTYDCGWVEQTNTAISYCNDDSGVSEACPKLCNNCRQNVVVTPTPPPKTPSPTRSPRPSLRPTTTPSTPTSNEPSTSPTNFCADIPSFFYLEEKKTCAFIDLKRKRRIKFCEFEEVRLACPRTCGVCNCVDSLSFRLTIKKTLKKKCQWVGRGGAKRKRKFCKSEGKFSAVLLNCPKSCKKCRKPVHTTQSPTTSSPTISSQPTLSPSLIPSTIPSSMRTQIQSPTSLCLDDPDFNYQLQGRNCVFIGSQEFLRQKYCPTQEVANNCLKTCGVCCEDDPSFTYLIDGDDQQVCRYLTALPSDTTLRISKYCNHYQGVDEGCPKSCDNCPSSF